MKYMSFKYVSQSSRAFKVDCCLFTDKERKRKSKYNLHLTNTWERKEL